MTESKGAMSWINWKPLRLEYCQNKSFSSVFNTLYG